MTEQDRKLLLKDLCARLPYGVKCVFHSKDGDIPSTIFKIHGDVGLVDHIPDGQRLMYIHKVEDIISYLRPMSSMTEEEWKELGNIANDGEWVVADFYYSHHLDCWGLIAKGLAVEAPKDMYN